MEEAQCWRSKVSDTDLPYGGADEPSTVPEGFWQKRPIDELAVDQGIVVPQQIGKLLGAAAELWDDEDDFQSFVEGIHQRRIEGGRYGKEDG